MNPGLLLFLKLIFSLFAFLATLLFILKPELAIEIQRRFYTKINWKIEPISKSLEIRNTRIMGYFLLLVLVVTLFLFFSL